MSEAMELYKAGKGKHPAGRPTLYNKAILRNAKHYLAHFKEYGNELPTVAGMAVALNTSRDNLYTWAKHPDRKELSDTLKALKVKQEMILLDKGLNGTFNSKIAGIVLNNHGYSEKVTDQAVTGITVNVNRGSVQIQHGTESLTISDIETDQVTIEHEDNQS